jgi:mRNA-degrading endonuclease RelE of RelBE toxin-antitoxin system
MGEDPRHADLDLKQLRKKGVLRFYRARVGDYRIVFSPRPTHLFVWRIQHRSEGYDWLERFDPPAG